MLYQLLAVWFGRRDIARLGAFLLSLSAVDIQYSYYISNPNLLPFFLLWFFYCLTKVCAGDSRWRNYIGLGLALGIATQLHATALLLLPVLLIISVLWYRKFWNWARAIIAAVLAGVTYLPYIIYEFAHSFSNSRGALFLGKTYLSIWIHGPSAVSVAVFWQSVLLSRVNLFDFAESHLFLAIILLIGFIICAAGGLALLKRRPESDSAAMSQPGVTIFFLWIGLGTMMFLLFRGIIQSFYFLVLWPAPIILVCWLAARLLAGPKVWGWCFVGIFVLAQALQLWYFYPLIYKPALAHGNILAIFKRISAAAGSQSYVMVNNLLDINEFHYYQQLSGMPTRSATNVSVVYVLCAAAHAPACHLRDSAYRPLNTFIQNGLLVVQYQKI